MNDSYTLIDDPTIITTGEAAEKYSRYQIAMILEPHVDGDFYRGKVVAISLTSAGMLRCDREGNFDKYKSICYVDGKDADIDNDGQGVTIEEWVK